jgi:hypothetical protein
MDLQETSTREVLVKEQLTSENKHLLLHLLDSFKEESNIIERQHSVNTIGKRSLQSSSEQSIAKRARLTEIQSGILQTWFDSRITSPYPTNQEKLDLGKQTGLSVKQIENWFVNTRKRKTSSHLQPPHLRKLNDFQQQLEDSLVKKGIDELN